MDGIIAIDKPIGMTSHDVVNKVRRITGQRKCGHTGTLDPFASGILICCLGKATRLVQFITEGTKTYEAEISLGIATDTYDKEGAISNEDTSVQLDKKGILEVLPQFTGEILQVPPMYSALHHEGKRLYELAREGIEVERVAREVEVHGIEIIGYDNLPNVLTYGDKISLKIICSKGTYIRTLAHDICIKLGTFGHLSALRRTGNAGFSIDDTSTLDELTECPKDKLLPLTMGVQSLANHTITTEDVEEIGYGRSIKRYSIPSSSDMVALMNEDRLIAIADNSDECEIKPKIVFI